MMIFPGILPETRIRRGARKRHGPVMRKNALDARKDNVIFSTPIQERSDVNHLRYNLRMLMFYSMEMSLQYVKTKVLKLPSGPAAFITSIH